MQQSAWRIVAISFCLWSALIFSVSADASSAANRQCGTADESCSSAETKVIPRSNDRPWLGWQRPDPLGRRIAVGTPQWGHHFHLITALRSDARITAVAFLMRPNGRSLLALADETGSIMLTNPGGHVLAEWDSGGSNVTALASYQSQQLGTVILSGHDDGSVRMHAIHFENAGVVGEAEAVQDILPLRQLIPKPPRVPLQDSTTADSAAQQQAAPQGGDGDNADTTRSSVGIELVKGGGEHNSAAVTHLLSQPLGNRIQIAALRRDGSITVWQEDGVERMTIRGSGPYLAVRWSPKGYLALIKPYGGAMLMTRPSPLPAAIWPRECAGLDGTLLAAAAFDPGAPLVLHAIDSDGVPLTLGLGNAISLFGCQVRHRQNSSAAAMAAPIGPLSVTAFPQHMVAASQQGVLLINTTATPSGPPQAVLMAPYSALTSGIMKGLSLGLPTPIIEFQEGLLAVTLAADILAVYHSQLPTGPPHQSTAYIKALTRPLCFILLVVGIVFGLNRRQRSAKRLQDGGYGPDDVDFDTLLEQLGGVPARRTAAGLSVASGSSEGGWQDDVAEYGGVGRLSMDRKFMGSDMSPEVLEALLRGGMEDNVMGDFDDAAFDEIAKKEIPQMRQRVGGLRNRSQGTEHGVSFSR